MTDRIRTVDMSDPAVVLDCYRKLNIAYKELKAENEKLRAALKLIAETYNKPTTSKDGLAFIAAAALKETGE